MKQTTLLFIFALLFFACKHAETVVNIQTSEGNIRVKLYDDTPIHKNNFLKLINEEFYSGILFHRVIQNFMIQAGDPESKNAPAGIFVGAKDNGYMIDAEILPQYYHRRGVLAAARESDIVNPERKSSGSHFYIVQGTVFSPDSLERAVKNANDKRYTALFNKLKGNYEGEIAQKQLSADHEGLMEINEKISNETRKQFENVKLVLSDEQKNAYTTVGGSPHLDGEYTVFGEVIEGMDVVGRIAAQETDGHFRPKKEVVILRMTIEK